MKYILILFATLFVACCGKPERIWEGRIYYRGFYPEHTVTRSRLVTVKPPIRHSYKDTIPDKWEICFMKPNGRNINLACLNVSQDTYNQYKIDDYIKFKHEE